MKRWKQRHKDLDTQTEGKKGSIEASNSERNLKLNLVFRLILLFIVLAGIVEKLIVTQIFFVVLRL